MARFIAFPKIYRRRIAPMDISIDIVSRLENRQLLLLARRTLSNVLYARSKTLLAQYVRFMVFITTLYCFKYSLENITLEQTLARYFHLIYAF